MFTSLNNISIVLFRLAVVIIVITCFTDILFNELAELSTNPSSQFISINLIIHVELLSRCV